MALQAILRDSPLVGSLPCSWFLASLPSFPSLALSFSSRSKDFYRSEKRTEAEGEGKEGRNIKGTVGLRASLGTNIKEREEDSEAKKERPDGPIHSPAKEKTSDGWIPGPHRSFKGRASRGQVRASVGFISFISFISLPLSSLFSVSFHRFAPPLSLLGPLLASLSPASLGHFSFILFTLLLSLFFHHRRALRKPRLGEEEEEGRVGERERKGSKGKRRR